jgi:pSer/pThr/pTyr-binding forkhead associated (FHA) protein
MLRPKIATPDEALSAQAQSAAGRESGELTQCAIVLKPITHPELGDIRIDESLFAIGRTEPPFASYASDIIADLSRRHARIFFESGAVYLADLDSKNGTSVNGVEVRQKTSKLQDGDEICFGRALCYRVQLGARVQTPGRAAKLLSLTLTPERSDLGLHPIAVTQFPFLISKADEAFSRYKGDYPHQVNYLSRRHAHIFLKGGTPFIEDLGSTNGTFIGDKRLDEHAVPVEDGDRLAFGGHHFVYKASLQKEEVEVDPTVTKLSPTVRSAAKIPGDADKTTFVAAADSFLDIFCVDRAPQQDDEVINEELKQSDDAGKGSDKRRARSKFAILLSELTGAFADSERKSMKRLAWWGTSLIILLAMVVFVIHRGGAPERELKDLLASGEYPQAATLAVQYSQHAPENAELKALATEALIKANVPEWLRMLKAGEFDRAAAILAGMKQAGRDNADVQSLVSELEWIGNLEKFVIGRGGVDAPIRVYADEDMIKTLLKRWDEDTKDHQRAVARISSYVPEFKDPYAEALSHLRKLQSDDAVYLGAIERLKAAIVTELNQDRPAALEAVLKEYSEKYPRLGVESLRQDMRQYIQIENEARARNLGPLVAHLAKARFSTPPFQAKFRTLTTSDRLPPADVIQQYQAVSAAWREGNARQAFESLQKMSTGKWADAASKEAERKKAVMDQFTELQKARGTKGYDERILSFYGSLNPDEDIYFMRAVAADVGLHKDKALALAKELLNRAQDQWRQYRENGAIEGRQRLEAAISNQFRTQARLLSQAHQDAQQGMQIYIQLKADPPVQWSKVRDEINAEEELQRKSLLELRNVLEPALLKAKLAMLGGSDDERSSPKTVN